MYEKKVLTAGLLTTMLALNVTACTSKLTSKALQQSGWGVFFVLMRTCHAERQALFYIFDQKVLSAKKLPLLIRHTKSGSTSIRPGKNPVQNTGLPTINPIKDKKQGKNRKEKKICIRTSFLIM